MRTAAQLASALIFLVLATASLSFLQISGVSRDLRFGLFAIIFLFFAGYTIAGAAQVIDARRTGASFALWTLTLTYIVLATIGAINIGRFVNGILGLPV